MTRLIALLLLIATPASAEGWTAAFGAVCELSYQADDVSVLVTYDPSIPEYAIALTPDGPWRNAPIFSIRFDGAQGRTITTDRHEVSEDGATLTVRDRGFGNVLDGIEFNETAFALLGNRSVAVPLQGAAPAVQAFRSCTAGVSA